MAKEDEDRWRAKMARAIFKTLNVMRCTTFIASFPNLDRSDLRRLIERWMREEDERDSARSHEERERCAEMPPEGTFLCWAVHTGKPLKHLLGRNVTDIDNLGTLIDIALHDESAMEFSGLLEAESFELLAAMLLRHKPLESDACIRVTDPCDPHVKGRLFPNENFVIIRVSQQPVSSRPGDYEEEPEFDIETSDSTPPPLN